MALTHDYKPSSRPLWLISPYRCNHYRMKKPSANTTLLTTFRLYLEAFHLVHFSYIRYLINDTN